MIQDKEIDISEEYFNWLYHLVCNNRVRNKISYKKLLRYLHSVIFEPRLEMDEKRRVDGINFRYRFAYESGYPDAYVDEYLNYKDCSVLEMMIALSYKVEENITGNYIYGNRTGQWFWSMIVSLGLNKMNDKDFSYGYCDRVIDDFLAHRYQPNGEGGLFTLQNPYRDLRDVDIWRQFMWWLNENNKEEYN